MTSPFPGESLAVAGSGNTSGSAIAPGFVTYRADSATFTAGDESWVDVPLYPLLLEAGDAAGVEVKWVVEVLSGSGTLALAEDAGSLGSHTVTAGTLVVAASLTGADVVAGGTARLTIECTSGTVVVQQVKLRVWPVGGPLGGYSDPYTPPPVSVNIATRFVTGNEYGIADSVYGATLDEAFQNAEQALAGGVGAVMVGDPSYFAPSTEIAAQFAADASYTPGALPQPGRGQGTISASVVYVERSGDPYTPDPAGTFGVDWIYPPNEVPYDPDGWQWAGASQWGWYQGVATVIVNVNTLGDPPGNFRVAADPVDGVDPMTLTFGEIFPTANVIAAIEAAPLSPELEFDLPAMSDAGMLRLAFWHDGAIIPPYQPSVYDTSNPDGTASKSTLDANANVRLGRYVADVFQPVQASHTRPYRYWTPTGAPKPAPHLIFQRSDGLGAGAALTYKRDTRQSTGTVYGNY